MRGGLDDDTDTETGRDIIPGGSPIFDTRQPVDSQTRPGTEAARDTAQEIESDILGEQSADLDQDTDTARAGETAAAFNAAGSLGISRDLGAALNLGTEEEEEQNEENRDESAGLFSIGTDDALLDSGILSGQQAINQLSGGDEQAR
jgi:hypothetical protein